MNTDVDINTDTHTLVLRRSEEKGWEIYYQEAGGVKTPEVQRGHTITWSIETAAGERAEAHIQFPYCYLFEGLCCDVGEARKRVQEVRCTEPLRLKVDWDAPLGIHRYSVFCIQIDGEGRVDLERSGYARGQSPAEFLIKR